MIGKVVHLYSRVDRVTVLELYVLVRRKTVSRIAPARRKRIKRSYFGLRGCRIGDIFVAPFYGVIVVGSESELKIIALRRSSRPQVDGRVLHHTAADAMACREAPVLQIPSRVRHRSDEVVLQAE